MKNAINNIPIKGIKLDILPCEIIENNDRIKGCCIMNNTCKYKNGKKEFMFTTNDIVVSINNLKIERDNFIYFDLLDIFVPVNTYIMLYNIIYPYRGIDFSFYRENSEKIKKIHLDGIEYENMYKYRIKSNNEYVLLKGYIFLELSEELINYFRRNNIILTGKIFDNFNIGKFDMMNDNSRYVILLNYDSKFNDKSDKYNNLLRMPLVNNRMKHYFMLVDKVGNKKIHNINDLKKIFNEIDNQKNTNVKNTNVKNTIIQLIDNEDKIVKIKI